MYAVVGCRDCGALWVVADRPETTQCPRCGTRRKYAKLKQFVTTDSAEHAKEVRASMLANRQGYGDAFADLDSFAEMEAHLDDAGPDDESYLEASGVDVDAVEAAGERASQGVTSGSADRKTVLKEALDDLDQPTKPAILDYATDRDVPPSAAESTLEKLVAAGEVSESRGEYRLL
jgi:hypothetical protein